jgi:Zn-dependent metalloprotease
MPKKKKKKNRIWLALDGGFGRSWQPDQQAASTIKDTPTRFVYNAQNTIADSGLPGTLVRIDGQSQAGDSAINQAFDNIGIVMQFYRDLFEWKSLDNQNGDVTGSVHVGNHMQNAYWNGSQMLSETAVASSTISPVLSM